MIQPSIFIGGECSGVVRRAILKLDPSAVVVSCDLKPAEDTAQLPVKVGSYTWQSGHVIGDMCDTVRLAGELGLTFHAGLWHPVCTYLTNSAAWAYADPDYDRYPDVGYHQQVALGTLTGARRREAREEQVRYIARILALPIGRKLLENPAAGALTGRIGPPSQILQPYMFGDDASKATGIWNRHAAPIEIPPENEWVKPRWVEDGRGASDVANGNRAKPLPRWANQTDTGQNRVSPGPNRTADRSRTYPGIGAALAKALLASAYESMKRERDRK